MVSRDPLSQQCQIQWIGDRGVSGQGGAGPVRCLFQGCRSGRQSDIAITNLPWQSAGRGPVLSRVTLIMTWSLSPRPFPPAGVVYPESRSYRPRGYSRCGSRNGPRDRFSGLDRDQIPPLPRTPHPAAQQSPALPAATPLRSHRLSGSHLPNIYPPPRPPRPAPPPPARVPAPHCIATPVPRVSLSAGIPRAFFHGSAAGFSRPLPGGPPPELWILDFSSA